MLFYCIFTQKRAKSVPFIIIFIATSQSSVIVINEAVWTMNLLFT